MLTSNHFAKGLSTDTAEKYQPDGTYRFALNAVLETEEGELSMISNERGNYLCATNFPEGKIVIGHVLLNDGTVALFVFDPAESRPYHEIGIFNGESCTYTKVLEGECLNFSDKHPINAIYRLKNGCDRLIYFTDDFNPYRVVNIDQPQIYASLESPTIQDGGCDKLRYSREYYLPSFDLNIGLQDSGGKLKVGLYYFAIRYLDEQFSPTDWLLVSNPVSIADEKYKLTQSIQTAPYYDGGSNVPNAPGYVEETTKSIRLELVDVDTRFKYVQIAAVKRTTDEGIIESVDVLFPEIISEAVLALTDMSVIYTGNDSQIQYQTTIEDLFAERVKIDIVTAHAIKDNTLFVGNISKNQKSYIGFQRHASSIKTEYVANAIANNEKESKQHTYYFGNGSFLHDEVYSFGIVYVWFDGEISPVFHIPGRGTVDNTGNALGTNVQFSGNEDVWDTYDVTGADLNVYNENKTLRWQVYNTYIETALEQGLMGYHESQATYPYIAALCDDHPDGYWGRDWQGNEIQASITPIRHHRMPPINRSETGSVNGFERLGVLFSFDAEYPHPDIVGHYFVFGDRTYDKTIVDKGILLPLTEQEQADDETANLLSYKGKLFDEDHDAEKTYAYISPKVLFENKYTSADYINVDRADGSSNSPEIANLIYASVNNDIYSVSLNCAGWVNQYTAWDKPLAYNYVIEEDTLIPKSPMTNGTRVTSYVYSSIESKTIQNNSVNNNIAIISLERPIEEVEATIPPPPFTSAPFFKQHGMIYVALKVDNDVFANLFSIKYRRMGSQTLNKFEDTPFAASLYDGDIFVVNLNVTDFTWVQSGTNRFVYPYHMSVFLESEINIGFRHGDKSNPTEYSYYQFPYKQDVFASDETVIDSFKDYISTKYYEVEVGKMNFKPETYLLNKSYNHTNSIQRYYPLPFEFDVCNDCSDSNAYRIYHSQSDDAEAGEDRFRRVLPNNYIDIDGNTGGITDMFISLNELYCTTLYSAYLVPTNVQRLTTLDTTEVYLGKASTLQFPPRQLKNSTSALGGNTSFTSRTTTEFGTFYMDAISGRAFTINKELKDLSLQGLRNFFENYSTFSIDKQFRETFSQPYPINSPIAKFPCGYTSTYDPRTKRIIVTKKDFAIKPAKLPYLKYEPTNSDPYAFWFDGTTFYINDDTGTPSELFADNIEYFESTSFTLSYSFLHECWVSFHSYLPKYLFNDNNTFYSNSIYKHSGLLFQTYYGTKFDHIIDCIAKYAAFMQNTLSNIYYNSTTKLLDPVTSEYYNFDKTFDRLVAYNSTQSTGIQTLALKSPMTIAPSSDSTIEVKRTDRQWRINELRDYTLTPNAPIWNSNIPNSTSTFYFTDKLPNSANIDPLKSGYELKRLKDHYAGIRFYFKPQENLKISTDLIQTVYANRNR